MGKDPVKLDKACRKQQMGGGRFPNIDNKPKETVSHTITPL
jgi:hypothetical protein